MEMKRQLTVLITFFAIDSFVDRLETLVCLLVVMIKLTFCTFELLNEHFKSLMRCNKGAHFRVLVVLHVFESTKDLLP